MSSVHSFINNLLLNPSINNPDFSRSAPRLILDDTQAKVSQIAPSGIVSHKKDSSESERFNYDSVPTSDDLSSDGKYIPDDIHDVIQRKSSKKRKKPDHEMTEEDTDLPLRNKRQKIRNKNTKSKAAIIYRNEKKQVMQLCNEKMQLALQFLGKPLDERDIKNIQDLCNTNTYLLFNSAHVALKDKITQLNKEIEQIKSIFQRYSVQKIDTASPTIFYASNSTQTYPYEDRSAQFVALKTIMLNPPNLDFTERTSAYAADVNSTSSLAFPYNYTFPTSHQDLVTPNGSFEFFVDDTDSYRDNT